MRGVQGQVLPAWGANPKSRAEYGGPRLCQDVSELLRPRRPLTYVGKLRLSPSEQISKKVAKSSQKLNAYKEFDKSCSLACVCVCFLLFRMCFVYFVR